MEEGVGEPLDVHGALVDLVQVALHLVHALVAAVLEDLRVQEQRGEGSPQVVRHGGHEIAVGLERPLLGGDLSRERHAHLVDLPGQAGQLVVALDGYRLAEVAASHAGHLGLELLDIDHAAADAEEKQDEEDQHRQGDRRGGEHHAKRVAVAPVEVHVRGAAVAQVDAGLAVVDVVDLVAGRPSRDDVVGVTVSALFVIGPVVRSGRGQVSGRQVAGRLGVGAADAPVDGGGVDDVAVERRHDEEGVAGGIDPLPDGVGVGRPVRLVVNRILQLIPDRVEFGGHIGVEQARVVAQHRHDRGEAEVRGDRHERAADHDLGQVHLDPPAEGQPVECGETPAHAALVFAAFVFAARPFVFAARPRQRGTPSPTRS